ncbi:(2Fe-2S)-binding protein [Candidatus Poriferisodalis sp.]|uniref:(2Fe-2S)-binding protein n=1 Tax=Candidatus Poriferisodalis sp. TaxID=3101277 RepID=UPI003B01E99F
MSRTQARTHVSCEINGDAVDFLTEDGESLLNTLRDELGLTGAKEGCGTGDCGACSIIMDGNLQCSCLIFAPEANGTQITTCEGLATAGELHPLQQCFLEGAALQCGVCTPGFLVAAKVLLDANPNPTETEVRYALAGNLCRCTGYDKIVRSVLDAAVQIRTSAA